MTGGALDAGAVPAGTGVPCSRAGRPAALALVALAVLAVVAGTAAAAAIATPGADTVLAAPEHAWAVLALVHARGGEPPPGYAGGRTFHNRERRLPPGRYREYDVHPRRPGRSRGAERIVVERVTGRAWYTPDHYRTFVPMVDR